LCTLSDHITVLFEFEFKTARATYSLPVDSPNGEVENVIVAQGAQETNLGLANHPEQIQSPAIIHTQTNRIAPIPGGFNEVRR